MRCFHHKVYQGMHQGFQQKSINVSDNKMPTINKTIENQQFPPVMLNL
jgi:hypothetical protein